MLKNPHFDPWKGGEKHTQTTYNDRHLRARSGFFWVIVALAIVAIVVFFGALAAHNYFYPAGAPSYYGYPGFGWWFFFPFGFFFIFIIVFFVGRLIFWPWWGWGWRSRYWHGYGDAHEILRQRYARGEITKEQFDQMTRDLEQHQ